MIVSQSSFSKPSKTVSRNVITTVASAVVLAAIAAVPLRNANAQRFEGIITFKVNAPSGAGRVGRAGESRTVEGRGAAGRAGGTAGAAAQGGGARSGGGRAGGTASGTAAGRGSTERSGVEQLAQGGRGTPQLTEEQAEAMRSVFQNGLSNFEYMTRRGRVRIAVGGTSGGPVAAALIYAPEEGLMFTLLPAISMYSETDIADVTNALGEQAKVADSARARTPQRPPVVTHTKKFELVAGHKCEHLLIEFNRQTTDVCMGKGLGIFIMPSVMGRTEGWTSAITDANGFPLKVIQPNGTVTLEVTKIERKALPEALFNVPGNYTRMPDVFMRRPQGPPSPE